MSPSDRIRELLARQKPVLFLVQAGISGCTLGALIWLVTSWVKARFPLEVPPNLYAWTYIYFHPTSAHRLNYLILCGVFGLVAMSIYVVGTGRVFRFIRSRLESLPLPAVIASLVLSVCLLCLLVVLSSSRAMALIILTLVTCSPPLLLCHKDVFTGLRRSRLVSALLVAVTASALLFVFYEQYQVIRGPVYLMNEYADIYANTKIDGVYVNNRVFLDRTRPDDMDLMLDVLQAKNRLGETRGGQRSGERPVMPVMNDGQILLALRDPDAALAYDYARLIDRTNDVTEASSQIKNESRNIEDPKIENLDTGRLKKFYLANYLEVSHQNMARGQVNHFGHVLNPINEYTLGKPLRDVYVQYGLGNTFLMKWVMDLFGGISIQNYYKTYLYYSVYYLSYLVMLIYLFKNTLYVTGAFASVTACFFAMGYVAYIVAPGIIPSIHLLDAVTFTFFVMFLRRGKKAYFGVSILLSLAAMVVNRQFGSVLFLALIGSTALMLFEKKRPKYTLGPLVGLAAVVVIGLVILKISDYGSFQTIFSYLWAGFFSWPAQRLVIILTIVYLVCSYSFLLALRGKNFYLKYVYVFVFLYGQSILLYYYWSGLVNHLPPVLPFLVLQFFLMVYILEKHLLEGHGPLQRLADGVTVSAALLLVVITIPLAAYYYGEKAQFLSNFRDHRTYAWQFERASLVTTINTDLIKESIGLIHKYSSPTKPRLYIISKYDNLLPFVSARYSAFPMFDVASYLFSKREYDMLLTQLRTEKPEYLFVDSDIYQSNDPWAKLYHTPFFQKERASRVGRYMLLTQLFDEVKNDYQKVEQGKLISVYKRKM